MNKKERIGILRERVTIQTVTETQSTSGFPVTVFIDYATRWAAVNYRITPSDESTIADRKTAETVCIFRLRYDSTVTEKHVLSYGGTWDIRAISITPDKFYMDLEAVRRDDYAQGTASGFYSQNFNDQVSSTLTWTENSGVLPANTVANVWVFQNGSRLTETLNYTISGSNIIINSGTHIIGADYYILAIEGSPSATYYAQSFPDQNGSVLTWTENGGVLPTTNTEATIHVYMNGQKIFETTQYTVAGDEITIDAGTHYAGAYYFVVAIIE